MALRPIVAVRSQSYSPYDWPLLHTPFEGGPVSQDRTYLDKLREYYAQYRVIPSYETIKQILGFKSKTGAVKFIARMMEAGFITEACAGRLRPETSFFQLPLYESVQAGFPSPANDFLSDSFSLDEYLVDSPTQSMLIKVKGDSMKDAQIDEGDIVIVERTSQASVGEIIVALVDNEYTIKYLAKDKQGYFLRPANDDYEDIRAEQDLQIFGIVRGLVRKYA
jgi:SOS regulatory protein LexA